MTVTIAAATPRTFGRLLSHLLYSGLWSPFRQWHRYELA
ncbi:MAG: hypothetical protein OJF49_000774 [Ktedonobacterales bacterium]|nr:MAG: hypothetical protein OJF49_000774 [Ktedonobacterales bacterium]